MFSSVQRFLVRYIKNSGLVSLHFETMLWMDSCTFSSALATPAAFGVSVSRSRRLCTDWFVNSLVKFSSVWSFSSCASCSLALFLNKTQLKPIRTKCGKFSWSISYPGCFIFVHCGNFKEDRQNLPKHGFRYYNDVFHLAQNLTSWVVVITICPLSIIGEITWSAVWLMLFLTSLMTSLQ